MRIKNRAITQAEAEKIILMPCRIIEKITIKANIVNIVLIIKIPPKVLDYTNYTIFLL